MEEKVMEASTDSVRIEVTLSAPLEAVWKAWTQPDQVTQWWGSDPNGKGVSARMDVRQGGLFEISFVDGDQTEHTCSGVYREVIESQKLSFTWSWKSEPGVESLVTLEMTPENNFTRVLFLHEHLGTGSQHNYLQGWKSTFQKLEQMLVKRK